MEWLLITERSFIEFSLLIVCSYSEGIRSFFMPSSFFLFCPFIYSSFFLHPLLFLFTSSHSLLLLVSFIFPTFSLSCRSFIFCLHVSVSEPLLSQSFPLSPRRFTHIILFHVHFNSRQWNSICTAMYCCDSVRPIM